MGRGDKKSVTGRRWVLGVVAATASAVVVGVGAGALLTLNPQEQTVEASVPQHQVGSDAIGDSAYPVPSGALFVATNGNDDGTGSKKHPFKTIQAAVHEAKSGDVIVLRGGSYHQSVKIPDLKTLTLQPYPHEAVWLDGSSPVTSWQAGPGGWVHSGWTAEFDSSPTYTPGAPDNTAVGWAFIDPAHPLAAHPDQVWVDGVAQRQVGSASEVHDGTFYVDYAADTLTLGTDPTGKSVRASDLAKAVSIRGPRSVLRGIGIHRFAPSVPAMGAVTAEKRGITIENVTITDCSTTGLFVMGADSVVRNVTLERNGMQGGSLSTADSFTGTGILSVHNNTEHFNNAPVSGGLKVTRSRHVTITNSSFSDNNGPGLWFDQSDYDGVVSNTRIADNDGHGLILEISAKFDVVNNVISGNSDNGLKINDMSDVSVWNNTISGNGRNVAVLQDNRRASDASQPGHDSRRKQPDATMTWVTADIVISNNIIANGAQPGCMTCVLDYSDEFTGAQMGVTLDGNLYGRSAASADRALITWARGADEPVSFRKLGEFTEATGQAQHSLEVTGAVLDDTLQPTDSVRALEENVARPLPERLARLAGQETGIRKLGSWLRP